MVTGTTRSGTKTDQRIVYIGVTGTYSDSDRCRNAGTGSVTYGIKSYRDVGNFERQQPVLLNLQVYHIM